MNLNETIGVPKPTKKILISGASIAGLTLGHWLKKYHYNVTIIEIASHIRKGGSPVDIKGDAVEVVRKMKLFDAIEKKKVTTEKVYFVNRKDKVLASMSPSLMDENTSGDIEIQREFLVDILYEKVKNTVEFIFNNTITRIENNSDNAIVHIKEGASRSFDHVIGADGLHSNVRRLVFGEESSFSIYHGMYAGVVEIDADEQRKNSCTLFNTKGKMAGIYNFNNKANAILVFHSKKEIDYNYKDLKQQKEILMEAFSTDTWEIPEILRRFNNSSTIYFDSVAQIKMKNWSKNRTALVGDAAYCASFLTGRGASLAILGAYTLAVAIKDAGADYNTAFKNYEKIFRPFAERAQSSIKAGAMFLVPKRIMTIWLRNLMLKTIVPIFGTIRKKH